MSISLRNPSKDPEPNRRYGDKPVSGVSTIRHLGNDYGWGNGTQVYAAAAGTVSAVNWVNNRATNNRAGGYGNNIQIAHTGGYSTLYAHLPNSTPLVKVGQRVNQGDLIAVMGNTGNAAGVHLHFELRLNGAIIDPNPYIGAGALATAGGAATPVTPPKPKIGKGRKMHALTFNTQGTGILTNLSNGKSIGFPNITDFQLVLRMLSTPKEDGTVDTLYDQERDIALSYFNKVADNPVDLSAVTKNIDEGQAEQLKAIAAIKISGNTIAPDLTETIALIKALPSATVQALKEAL